MKKRLFIAINLPQDTKEEIEKILEDLRNYENVPARLRMGEVQAGGRKYENIRFLPPENWHLTLTFLGYQPDEAIPSIIKSIKEAISILSRVIVLKNGLKVEFEKIIWAPPGRSPRMIWLLGNKKSSEVLSKIKNALEDELIKNNVKFQRETRPYNTHLTLARFHQARINADIDADLRGLNISVNQRIHQRESALSFQAQSLDLMESQLKRTGAEYQVLASSTFGNQ